MHSPHRSAHPQMFLNLLDNFLVLVIFEYYLTIQHYKWESIICILSVTSFVSIFFCQGNIFLDKGNYLI